MNKITIIVSSIISTIVLLSMINYNQNDKNDKNELKYKKIEFRRKVERKDSIATHISDSLIIPTEQKIKTPSSDILATWYQAHGSKTYSGETFHKDSLTAAYYAKMGTQLKVTNKSNGKSVIVRVTDRMGSKTKNRIDLSKKAFEEIADKNSGRIKVTVDVIE